MQGLLIPGLLRWRLLCPQYRRAGILGLRGRTQGYGSEALLQRVCLNTLTAARAGLGHLQGSRECQNIQVESMESSFPAPDAEKVQ